MYVVPTRYRETREIETTCSVANTEGVQTLCARKRHQAPPPPVGASIAGTATATGTASSLRPPEERSVLGSQSQTLTRPFAPYHVM